MTHDLILDMLKVVVFFMFLLKICTFFSITVMVQWRHWLHVCKATPYTVKHKLHIIVHKPTINRKTAKFSFLHHPLTEPLLITTMFFFHPYDLLFSSYTTVSVIQLKKLISRKVHFQFRIHTSFTNSPRNYRFIFDKCIQSSWTKHRQKVRSRGYIPSMT